MESNFGMQLRNATLECNFGMQPRLVYTHKTTKVADPQLLNLSCFRNHSDTSGNNLGSRRGSMILLGNAFLLKNLHSILGAEKVSPQSQISLQLRDMLKNSKKRPGLKGEAIWTCLS